MRILSLVLATTLVLSGCTAFSEGGGSGDSDLKVATGFYPLQFVVQRVGGDLVSVDNLTVPGQEPHDLELTIREAAAIAQADLVVFERGFQPAVDDGVETNAVGEVVDAADVVELHPGEENGVDPHFWQDPLLLADLGDAVADALAQVDEGHADDFAARAASLRTDLEALDASYAVGLAECERDTVVVSHDAFGYLEKYGLDFEAIAGLSPDAEPTLSDLGRLHQLIEDEGITTVFGERLAPPALVDTLARDAGVDAAVLDPLEGLTDETEGEDYVTLMTQNLDALRTANGCT
jgi:zinc transport system substrate-binding protein